MTGISVDRIKLAAAALMLVGAVASSAQSSPAVSIEPAALVGGLGLPQNISAQALDLMDRFVAQALESSKAMDSVLSSRKPGSTLDVQTVAKVRQIQKKFGLLLQRFELDLADIVGAGNAATLVGVMKAALPKVLKGPEGAASIAGEMPGMNGSVGSPRIQVLQRLLSTNNLIAHLLTTLSPSGVPDGVKSYQRRLLQQMLVNQAALLKRLAAGEVP